MRQQCKECPWVVKSKNNDSFIKHSKKHNKSHNCHMITKDVWNTKKECECVGYEKQKNHE